MWIDKQKTINLQLEMPVRLSTYRKGNAIDNAIEACEKIKDKSKKIDLTLICQDKRVFCKITNTIAERPNNIFKTSKSDTQNHGFGLDNIKTSLAKYNSEPTITQTNDEFIIKFIIFIK